MLQDRIINDLKESKDIDTKNDLKVIVGEFQRQPSKILSDEQVISILKKLLKYEEERLKRAGEQTSNYYELIKTHLPLQVSDEEIKTWIKENIEVKNSSSIGKILKHFGSKTNGTTVKRILSEI